MGNNKKRLRHSLKYSRKRISKRWNRNHEEVNQPAVVDNSFDQEQLHQDHEIGQQINVNNESMDQESFELEMAQETIEHNNYTLEGRRIIDIKHFWNQLKQLKHIPSFDCSIQNCTIIGEKRCGFVSTFSVKCDMCGETSYLETDQPDTEINCNTLSIIGTASVGCGYSQLEEIVSVLNIPHMSKPLYSKCHEQLAKITEDVLWQELKRAGEEERNIAIAKGDIDKDGYPCISVIVDGAWCKRSYKTNYNALSGVAVIIGEATKKVLFVGVKNKFCIFCTKHKTEENIPEHNCAKNWTGSSTSMEAAIILEGFKRSVEIHGMKFTKLIGDGDSSISRKLLEIKPYGALLVEKVECVHHLLRNFCHKLKDISKMRCSNSSQKVVPIVLRKKLESAILRFRIAIRKAAEFRSQMDKNLSEKLLLLKMDILNTPDHIFGEHNNCDQYFCQGPKPGEENLIVDATECGLKQDIVNSMQRLISCSSSLLLHKNNNAAERFNSLVNKFVGGKRINFSFRGSYMMRCQLAAISYNCNENYLKKLLEHDGHLSGVYTTRFMTRKKKRTDADRKNRFRRKGQNKSKTVSPPDEDYGGVEEPVSEDELIKRKEKLMIMLKKTDNEIKIIEKDTRGQSSNPSWKQERTFRLTASNFGKICKLRKTTNPVCLVKNLLYSTFVGNKATQYGKDHEAIALKRFKEVTGLETECCGIFVGTESDFYLGASPDGLIKGEPAIIEIKCPHKLKTISFEEGIDKKVLEFMVKSDTTGEIKLKYNHNYFYQVQGQLHITKKDYCYFVVWSPVGSMHIEIIKRDDSFWEQKMQNQLKSFYFTHLVPEIIKNPI